MAAAHRLTKSLGKLPRFIVMIPPWPTSILLPERARLMGRLTEARAYSRMSIGHLIIVQPKMVADLMNDRVAHFLHDFFGASAQAHDGPAVNRDSGRQLAYGIEK